MRKQFYLIIVLFPLFLSISCKKDDPEIPNEEETITTLTYTLTPTDGGSPVVLMFKDLDGEGGNPPILQGGILEANKTYKGIVDISNELTTPATSISQEVLEEAEDHQLFFSSTISGLTITYSDADANGKPIGLETTLKTEESGQGILTIILKHEPNKSASGVSDGIIDNAGGETDIEVAFNIEIQ